jgi:hypothetical protein
MSTIEPRIAYYKLAPDGIKHLQALERYLGDCGLEKSIIELVKMRASQKHLSLAIANEQHWPGARR